MTVTYLRKNLKLKSILLIVLFIPSLSWAAVYGYCFSRSTSLDSAINHLENIRSPRDRFHKRTSLNCLEVSGSLKMFDLYRKYLSSNYKVLRSYKGANAEIPLGRIAARGMCKIKITKTLKMIASKDEVKAGRTNSLARSETSKQVNSISNMVLSYGKKASLRVNEDSIGITCDKSGNGFQLGFKVEGKDSHLSSNAWVAANGKLDLGKIVNDLNEKNRSVSINDGMSYQKDKSNTTYNYSLEIK